MSSPGRKRESSEIPLAAVFIIALAAHFTLATTNWRAGFLPGHEFRQTHTAIIADYIDRENNFSPIYTVPLFGKPWVCPMEFPLYEWSVVGLSRATGWPHHISARSVSLGCFYLALPALYLSLGFAGLPPGRRLLTLALVLCCPLYIYYSRAFLMESMALMFSAWFLAFFLLAMTRRRIGWLAGAAFCGAAGGLVKSTTLFVWIVPAAAAGAWMLVGDLRGGGGWRPAFRTVMWGLGAVVLPAALLFWWVRYTDVIKEAHPSAYIFASWNLTSGNFHMYDAGARVSPTVWRWLLDGWRQGIMPPMLLLGLVAAGAAALPAVRWRVIGAMLLFVTAQQLFPYAYALQEYYFYACAFFGLAAVGFVLDGILAGDRWRAMRWAIVAVPFVASLSVYWQGYRRLQVVQSNGGSGLTAALRDLVPPGTVLVVAGDDWSPIIPYYSRHKALMVRNGLENDPAYLTRAYADLADETVGALVVLNGVRQRQDFIARTVAAFGLDPKPAFATGEADVYVAKVFARAAVDRLHGFNGYHDVRAAESIGSEADSGPADEMISRSLAAASYAMINPAPARCHFPFGFAEWDDGTGRMLLNAHPDFDLWVPAPRDARSIDWEFGIFPGAYERDGERTDGVEFIVDAQGADGTCRRVFRRLLDPAQVPEDRGRQHVRIAWSGKPGDVLVFRTRPNGISHYDWAYIARVDVH